MASSTDPWVREHGEAARLANDVASIVADRAALRQSGPEAMRHTSAICHKITILGTRLDTLEGMLARLPPNPCTTDKELYKRRDMLNCFSLQIHIIWPPLPSSHPLSKFRLINNVSSSRSVTNSSSIQAPDFAGLTLP
ncbi:syntaxin-52-like [Hordeum vulgare subsp. vulgare]|uniref:syntaxin-52-like n=1 Tax=Hordeum vulgare subsp. vulgare TaxID=112509 RepID=UPI001D1A5AF3|nr:syntaxin-52-like [Hordeum vulgare subsp. vulgare]